LVNIFNVSLHRSGTQSAHDLFRRAGVTAIHWAANVDDVDHQAQVDGRETDLAFVTETLKPVFAAYQAVSDAPIPALYRELAKQYPSARFFALYRTPETWVSSVRRHIGSRPFVPFERAMYWPYFEQRPESLSDLSDQDLLNYHEWHHISLRDFFRDADNFLLLPLERRGLGAALCDFCSLPRLPFRQFDYALGHDHGGDPDLVPARVTE
jgi:hypothetical protein